MARIYLGNTEVYPITAITTEPVVGLPETAIPDYGKGTDITSLDTYTCPEDGYLCIYSNDAASMQYKTSKITDYPSTKPFAYGFLNATGNAQSSMYVVEKNEVLTKVFYNGNASAYFVPFSKSSVQTPSASLPLLTRLISDHKFNDVSYLDSNTFSWQPGAVYQAVYEHLVSDFNGATKAGSGYYGWSVVRGSIEEGRPYYTECWTESPTPTVDDPVYEAGPDEYIVAGTVSAYNASTNTIEFDGFSYERDTSLDDIAGETIEGITIQYYLAEDGHRICTPDQETAVSNLYAKTGEANFYILDTANSQFKLPRTQKRKLIRAVKNGDSWYNLYSDGWVEQGGVPTSTTSVTLPVPMANSDYWFIVKARIPSTYSPSFSVFGHTPTPTGFSYDNASSPANQFVWQAEGYASDFAIANEPIEHEYYYVGFFEQTAVEQTAGLNAELFNNKADVNLQNVLANIDFVVESQLPTAANNYTWYRKYKSGWVEQGGEFGDGGSGVLQISLPVAMQDTKYNLSVSANISDGSFFGTGYKVSTTKINVWTLNYLGTPTRMPGSTWRVEGMAATTPTPPPAVVTSL